jgi:hypothetical protein
MMRSKPLRMLFLPRWNAPKKKFTLHKANVAYFIITNSDS